MLKHTLDPIDHRDMSNLSPAAQRLARAVSQKKSVSEALREDPSLADVLDEYTEWFGEVNRQISRKSTTKPMKHESIRVLKVLRLKRKH